LPCLPTFQPLPHSAVFRYALIPVVVAISALIIWCG
jgi:hypothetical protein